MRSRYSAFCTGNIDYLIASHHVSKCRADEREVLDRTIGQTRWLGLKIIKTGTDIKNENAGHVEFVAFYDNGTSGQMHECSSFIREKGQWYYLEGTILPPVKWKRNDPCWCNSGKKYKKCHGKS